MKQSPLPHGPGPWPARCGLLAVLCAVPLVLFGGTVTTLGAGMAVGGWLVAEGHFLLFFPVDQWFRDTPTFVEHTHRLFGVLVGLCALACVVAVFLRERRGVARASAVLALLAVCVQGTLGGLRVQENAPELAFVHGAVAQAVFALLVLNALVLSRAWREAPPAPRAVASELAGLASVAGFALLATYAQVVLGAWYRHGLRPAPVASSGLRLGLHALGALLVVASGAALFRRGAALRARIELGRGLERALARVPVLLLVQLLLGGLAWAGFRPGTVGPAEWLLSIAHVLCSAFLLANTAMVWLWARHLALSPAATFAAAPAAPASLEAR